MIRPVLRLVRGSPRISGEDGRIAADRALAHGVERGDRDAVAALTARCLPLVTGLAARTLRDPIEAEDVAQDTFIKVYRKLDQFDTSRRFGPWLFRIGVNHTLDYLRKQKRRGRRPLFSEVSKDRPLEPHSADPRGDLDLTEEVETVLAQIPEKYRKVLVLRDLENFPTSEIAAIEGRKEATIRWRLAEARNMFAERWTARQPD